MNFEGPSATALAADPSSVFGPVSALLTQADLAVANLETAITADGPRADKEFAFKAPPRALDAVEAAGIDVVSMANNHGMDYGSEGLAQSLAAISASGFPVLGIGSDEAAAYSPFITTIKGQSVGVIAATQVLDGSLIDSWTATSKKGGLASAKREDRLVQAVTELAPLVDTVIVFLHWGVEKDTCPSDTQKSLAQLLADSGADIVIGGHAHRLQGAGYLGSTFVGYGLGNFLFAANSADGARSGVLTVTVDRGRVLDYRWSPAAINSRNQPVPLSGAGASEAQTYWQGLRDCTSLTA